jgi:lysophospholipase L1-like esterase
MSGDQRLDDAYRRDELQAFLDDADVFAAAGDHGVRVVRETLRDHPRIGRVIFDGDSLTAGSGTNTSYPSCLMARWPRPTPWKNIAVGGETLETILQNAPTNVDPFYAKGRWRNVVVLWAGTNDIALWNHLTALIYSQLKQYAWARQARGYTVVVLTLLPRSDKAVQPVTDFEARRQELNRLIRSEWEGFADLLVDVGADPRIGDAGDELDSTHYLADRVHLNTEGQRVVAELVGGALRSLDDWAGLLR